MPTSEAGADAAEAEFRTLTPVRWGRRVGDHDIDVLVRREELIVTGLIHEWAAIAQTDGSASPVPEIIARELVANVVLVGHHGLHVVGRVVKRDPRTGAPHYRRAVTGSWRIRLIAGDEEHRRWFAALMRLAGISGIGRDHGIGGGRVLVDLPPRAEPRSVRSPATPAEPGRHSIGSMRLT